MSFAGIGLLLGLFLVPAVLLQLGHRLRHRTPRERRIFWGGLVGHSGGALISTIALMAPPVMWADGTLRLFAAHWAMVVCALLGAIIGSITLRQPSSSDRASMPT
jgi:hypothetical protein